MALFPRIPEDAVFLNSADPLNPLAAWSHHPFELDGATWPSVEHYFQAMIFLDPGLRERIRNASHPREARRIARRRFWKKRRDWKKLRWVLMTRGTWIKCLTHPEVAEALEATGERFIVEDSLYDYYWGCGRDQRGHNYYGRMLMDIRKRLRQEKGSVV